jgi:hypothetical protein
MLDLIKNPSSDIRKYRPRSNYLPFSMEGFIGSAMGKEEQ